MTFSVIVMGWKTDPGTGGDVVFLLSPQVMSSPFRLCLHKVVAALSIHCHHGYSSASTTLPWAEPPATTWATIGLRACLTGTSSNGRGSEWCQWKDETQAEMCIQTQSVRDLLLTHRLNKGGCHISSCLFEENRLGWTSCSQTFYSCLETQTSSLFIQTEPINPSLLTEWSFSICNLKWMPLHPLKNAPHYIWEEIHWSRRKKAPVRLENTAALYHNPSIFCCFIWGWVVRAAV